MHLRNTPEERGPFQGTEDSFLKGEASHTMEEGETMARAID